MSAIAKVLAAKGHVVSGSDLRGGATLDGLADLGLATYTGHHPEAVAQADLVVASSAVPEIDPEMEAARRAGIPVWRRPELLEAITAEIPTIGATGSHGKTTTTALLLSGLRAAGLDPSFIIGGEVVDVGTNGHLGTTDLLVLESDEAFRTFERLHLRGLVVTNIEPEHLDHFGTVAELEDAFAAVAKAVEGPVVACADDAGASRVAGGSGFVTYGTSVSASWRIHDVVSGVDRVSFMLTSANVELGVEVPRPGIHTARNAAGALALIGELGHDVEAAAVGLAGFHGVSRRWENRGTVAGVTIIDDYAHHPTEVAAVLEAASAPTGGRVWAVFQPHLYTRTERFAAEFGRALAGADVVVIGDVYGARETPIPGVTGEIVAKAARLSGAAEVHYVPHRADLAPFVAGSVAAGDLVLTLGAGDVTLVATELAGLLAGGLW